MKDTVDNILSSSDYVYEPKFSGNHITNWTIVDNFDVALEEAVERRSVPLLQDIFYGTQEFALAPSDVSADFKQAVLECVPEPSDK